MSKPAARLGDMTAHGGTIVVGFPTVLIGGMPAARMGDMHVCPMVTGLVPHVGGPVMLGSTGVLIGNMPAARAGDMLTCVGPPDVIAMGCPTVLIGEIGSGSASGGGAGGGAGNGAVASAAAAMFDNNESTTKLEHWVEFKFVDSAGLPVSGIPYKFTDPDGNEASGVLQLDGRLTRDAVNEGQSSVILCGIKEVKWSKDMAEVGDELTLTATLEGFEDGEQALVQIFKRDLRGPDVLVEERPEKIQSEQIETKWTYALPEVDEDVDLDGGSDLTSTAHFSAPAFYFEVLAGPCKGRSGLLALEDFIEIELKDDEGKALADLDYILYLPNGEIRTGKLDGGGKVKEEKIPAGFCHVRFPTLPDYEAG